MKPIPYLAAALLAAVPASAAPRTFAPGSTYEACFTPAQDCEGLIVSAIGTAKTTIKMQAYSFTSAPIAHALRAAARRGVKVEAILDRSQETAKYSGASYLDNAGIPVLIDYKPAIAHNKIIIIDGVTVLTGSFNFTRSAQVRNAENVLMITGDKALADSYIGNFDARRAESRPYRRLVSTSP